MTPIVRAKAGCQFATIAPAGFVILAAIQDACLQLGLSLTITAGTNGHADPADPHRTGEAYDLSVATLTDGQLDDVLRRLRAQLPSSAFTVLCETPTTEGLTPARASLVNLVNPSASALHVHIQRKKGTSYPAEAMR